MSLIKILTLIFFGFLALVFFISFSKIRHIENSCKPKGDFINGLHFLKKGRGPNLLMIHGASGNLNDYEIMGAIDKLSKEFTVYLVDRPGAGHSRVEDTGSKNYLQLQVDEISRFIEEKNLGPLVLVGHSLGGGLAAALAAQHPDQVRGLVLIAAAVYPIGTGASWYTRLATAPMFGSFFRNSIVPIVGPFILPKLLEKNFTPNPVPQDYAERACLSLLFEPARFYWNAKALNEIVPFLQINYPLYKNIQIPVSLIYGEDDQIIFTQVHSQEFLQVVPQAKLHMLSKTGHLPHHSQSDLLVEEIRRVSK